MNERGGLEAHREAARRLVEAEGLSGRVRSLLIELEERGFRTWARLRGPLRGDRLDREAAEHLAFFYEEAESVEEAVQFCVRQASEAEGRWAENRRRADERDFALIMRRAAGLARGSGSLAKSFDRAVPRPPARPRTRARGAGRPGSRSTRTRSGARAGPSDDPDHLDGTGSEPDEVGLLDVAPRRARP